MSKVAKKVEFSLNQSLFISRMFAYLKQISYFC